MQELLTAIVEDDLEGARRLLRKDAALATSRLTATSRYYPGVFHWGYAGDSALHLAAAGYRVEIVKLLLKAGADVNAAASRRKGSPLHYAADGFVTGAAWDVKKQMETIECLLENGARIDAQDANGATAMHRAVRTRCAEAVKYLLKAGSDPLIENKNGSTAFHLAVQNTGRGGSGEMAANLAQQEIIRAFLEFGIDATRKNSRGKSVASCARSERIREMVGNRVN